MPSRYLITTADQQTWKKDRPVLFLGEWCKRYSKRKDWEALDSKTVPYHWDDRQQIYQDFLYLQSFYEDALKKLAVALNNIHGVDHSIRYWRILLGPWLGYFIQMAYDRWQMVHKALQEFEVNGTTILDIKAESITPQNMVHFVYQLFVGDLWNHSIYKVILQEYTSVPCHIIKRKNDPGKETTAQSGALLNVKALIKPILGKLSSLLARRNTCFFIASYLGKAQYQLEVKLGQVPSFRQSPVLPDFPIDWQSRSKLNLLPNSQDTFEQFILSLLPKQIPTIYLEGYKSLVQKTETVGWPKNTELIFTANSHNSDDFFKAWAAQKVEKGAKLIIGQHGGHYGTGRWSFVEDHEIAISDRYFSWGWTKKDAPRVEPLPSIKLAQSSKTIPDPLGGLLLVTAAASRYSYWMYSIPVASQFADYFEGQFRFAEALLPEVAQKLVVRLYPHDYGWDQKQRWRDRLPSIRLDFSKRKMSDSIRNNRLFVGTYNATTFLETFAANFPTILFWDPKHWELRPAAQPYFDKLRRAGILHDTPESAAAKVDEIFGDPLAWWEQPEIQEAKNYFCSRFALTSGHALDTWCGELKNLLGSPK